MEFVYAWFMFKKFPVWLLGGVLGLLYYGVTWGISAWLVQDVPTNPDPNWTFLFLHLPMVALISPLFAVVPYPFSVLLLPVAEFSIGAGIGLLVERFVLKRRH